MSVSDDVMNRQTALPHHLSDRCQTVLGLSAPGADEFDAHAGRPWLRRRAPCACSASAYAALRSAVRPDDRREEDVSNEIDPRRLPVRSGSVVSACNRGAACDRAVERRRGAGTGRERGLHAERCTRPGPGGVQRQARPERRRDANASGARDPRGDGLRRADVSRRGTRVLHPRGRSRPAHPGRHHAARGSRQRQLLADPRAAGAGLVGAR